MNTPGTVIMTCALLALAIGCGRAPAPESAREAASEVPAALAAVFRAVASSAEPVAIAELRRAAKPGDAVVIEAKVIGAEKPFVDKRAVFIVGDPDKLTSCDLHEGDTCPTPWDVCCEDPRAIRENTATVQVVDAEGRVLPHGLRGIGGLRELSRVRVTGVVAPMSDGGALVINATAIEPL